MTIVVCRYRPPGNYVGQYPANVEGTATKTEAECEDIIGGIGDPHMFGIQRQTFDFTGEDGEWYALLHDTGVSINMRITAPIADVPEVTYITGLGLSLVGSDGELHTLEIVIEDPLDLEPDCPRSNEKPCLADGALTVLVDGIETGVGEVRFHLSPCCFEGCLWKSFAGGALRDIGRRGDAKEGVLHILQSVHCFKVLHFRIGVPVVMHEAVGLCITYTCSSLSPHPGPNLPFEA